MRPARALLFYVLGVFTLGALVAPWVYWLVQWAAEQLPALSGFAKAPFHRYVNRCLLVLALAGLWPFVRGLGVRSWAGVGIVRPGGQWGRLGTGFAIGFGSLACVAAVALLAEARVPGGGAKLWGKLGGIAGSAVVVAVLEELLFRGALFGALKRAHDWRIAMAVSSAVYAILHFFQRVPSPDVVTWTSGLQQLPRMMAGFVEWQMVVPGFFTLTLAGAILALAFQRTGNLYVSIGLHAGWIFWLKSYNVVTKRAVGAQEWIWGTGKLYDGWIAFAVLAAIFAVFWRWNAMQRAEANDRATTR